MSGLAPSHNMDKDLIPLFKIIPVRKHHHRGNGCRLNEISHIEAFSEHFRKLSFLSKFKIELSKAAFDTTCNKINEAFYYELKIKVNLYQ